MPISFVPYSQDQVPEVVAFNGRLQSAGLAYRFPQSPVPEWLPRGRSGKMFQEYFLGCQGDGVVRAAYILKHQLFALQGQVIGVGDYQYPVSEGLRDGRFAIMGLLCLKDALRRQPLLYGLGMGGFDEPVARLLQAARFRLTACPFLWRVNHPFRFLRGIRFLRRRPAVRAILDLAAFTGAACLAVRLLQALRTRSLSDRGFDLERVAVFDSRVDAIWTAARNAYSLIAVRDSEALGILYPREKERFIRLLLWRNRTPIGWAVMLETQMAGHKQFGDLRVGSIVDCLALPGEEPAVVQAATKQLSGADLVVTNQMNERWRRAFLRRGYLLGPSNFIFAAAPQLARRMEPFAENVRRAHLTRGDGDGPINL